MNRHPEVRLTSARCLQRASRTEGPCVRIDFMGVYVIKHKVPQGYSPADENAGLAYAFRDDDIIKSEKISN